MGAGAAAPTGVGSSPAPIVAPPVSTPIATPTATPSSTPQGGKGGPTTAGAAPTTPPPVTPSVSPVAPTAPQQPYVNPYMQTYGQNNTPQQQMFNRFPQRFQQPQPVAQPAQGPVYADQSLNAPGNQPQQYSGQPQYGRFGRGFMPQNRFGYDRQMDQLRGGYNRPMPPMMPQRDMGYGNGMPYSSSMDAGMGDPRGYANNSLLNGRQLTPGATPPPAGGTEAGWQSMLQQSKFAPGTDMVKAKQEYMDRWSSGAATRPPQQDMGYGGQQQGAKQAAFMNSLLNGQPLSGQPATGQTPIPAYAQPYATSLANQPNTPAGGKGGNPTAQLPPPPNQDGTPGSWSTYI